MTTGWIYWENCCQHTWILEKSNWNFEHGAKKKYCQLYALEGYQSFHWIYEQSCQRCNWRICQKHYWKDRNHTKVQLADKRTDVWSRNFMIWKINFEPWAVAWAGQWEKRVWADYEQLLRPIFSLFGGQIFFKIFLTPKKWKNRPQKLLIIGPTPFFS